MLLAEIAGGVAVVLSVTNLAVQISDNNRLLRSQAHYNALELAQRLLEIMFENENLSQVMVDCENDPENVDCTDWERCNSFYFIQFNSWEYLYYQHADESIPPQLWKCAYAYLGNWYVRTPVLSVFGHSGRLRSMIRFSRTLRQNLRLTMSSPSSRLSPQAVLDDHLISRI